MRLYITSEQLNKLSKKARERLDSWATKRLRSEERLRDRCWYFYQGEPRLSIGQMIEFLSDNDFFSDSVNDNQIFTTGGRWGIAVFHSFEGHWIDGDDYKELCDALWEAVKEVLDNMQL